MRVAVVGSRGVPATYGGIERHVEEIGARLVERGHEVTVYCRPHYSDNNDRPAETYRGMRRVVLPGLATKRLDALSHTLVAAAHAARQDFDVVHYHAVGPGIVSPLSRAAGRAAVVLTVHGLDFAREKWGVGARAALRTSARVSARVPHTTIVVAKALQEHYRETYGVETVYVPNGVTPAGEAHPGRLATFGLEPGGYLLSVGRMTPEKGPHLLVEAFTRLPRASRPRLVMVGGNSFTTDYLRSLHAQTAHLDDVQLPGYVYGDDLQALYAGARLFVQASTLEGMPLTVLEAAAHARPLVLSDIPVHVELLGKDRPGGRLFSSGDPAALSSALRTALEDGPVEERGGRDVGDDLLRRFSWDNAADGTLGAYERAVARRGPRRGRRA